MLFAFRIGISGRRYKRGKQQNADKMTNQANTAIFVEDYVIRDLLFCFLRFELYRDQDLRLTLRTVPTTRT